MFYIFDFKDCSINSECVCVCLGIVMCVGAGTACHGVPVEVRGQLSGVASLLPPWNLGIELRSLCLQS